MNQLFISIVGHNSTGKTTIAKRLEEDFGISRVNGDDFRLFIYKHVKFFQNEKLGLPSHKNDILNQFIINYRIELAEIMLKEGASVSLDGTGATKAWRKRYMDKIKRDFHNVKRVIIYAQLDEQELLKRLSERDRQNDTQIWTRHYLHLKKKLFEPPEPDEADYLLIYNQHNYDEVKANLMVLFKD